MAIGDSGAPPSDAAADTETADAGDAGNDAGDAGDAGNDAGNDTGPTGPSIEVAIEAYTLIVRQSCDGVDGEGDFFISVRLQDITGAEPVLLGESSENLVQAIGGANRPDLGFRVAGMVPAVTGTTVIANVSIYENDTDGPQVSVGMGFTYIYDAAAPCWRLEGGEECLAATGEIDVHTLELRDSVGDECNADLRARFSATPPS